MRVLQMSSDDDLLVNASSPNTPATSANSAEDDYDDQAGLSSTEITDKIYEYRQCLQQTEQKSISGIPYREITQFVCEVVSKSEDSASILRASRLYIDLLSRASVAYDDVTFSSCMHHISKFVKNSASASCSTHASNKSMLCTSSHHVAVRDYVSFWSHTVNQLDSSHFHNQNTALFSHLIRAFGDILYHSRISALIDQAELGICRLISVRENLSKTITLVYQMAFPLAINNIPAPNRNALVKVLTTTAHAEVVLHRVISTNNGETPAEDHHVDKSKDGEIDSSHDSDDADANFIHKDPTNAGDPSPRLRNRPLINFLKLCCLHVVDKADERGMLASTMHRVLVSAEDSYRYNFAKVLEKCAAHSKLSTRLVSLEVASRLVLDTGSVQSAGMSDILVSLIASRCNDRIASVRSKAISLLLDVVSKAPANRTFNPSLNQMNSYISSIQARLRDAKSTVRKAAVDFIGYACLFLLRSDIEGNEGPSRFPGTLILMLTYRCSDVVASVRLAAADQITNFIINYTSCNAAFDIEHTLKACFTSVLPLLDDVDTRCQETCLKLIHKVLINNCANENTVMSETDEGARTSQTNVSLVFFRILADQHLIIVRLAERAIFTLTKEGKLSDRDIRTICKVITTSLSNGDHEDRIAQVTQGAWVAAATIASAKKANCVWRAIGDVVIMEEIRNGRNACAYKVAFAHLGEMTSNEKEALEQEVYDVMFRKPNSEWTDGSGIAAASQVMSRLRDDLGGDPYLERCEEIITVGDEMENNEIAHVLHLIGNICEHMKLEKVPSEKVLTFVQAMTRNEGKESRIRALALVTLGTICLCETKDTSNNRKAVQLKIGENLTRRFVSVFVHELDNATSSATRSNAVIILCDLCRQYTSIVEPFIMRIAGLLSDKSVFVRNQVLCSLMLLLQEDYIKVRAGFLLFQIAKCLLDDCEHVRRTAEYSIIHVISQKNKSVLIVAFVEMMMVLNECDQSNTVVQFRSAIRLDVTTSGRHNMENRKKIYEVLLRGMSTIQRWRIPARLRNDILCRIVEEKMSLDADGVGSVLEDCLDILSWDKVNIFTKRRVGESGIVEASSATEQQSESLEARNGDASGRGTPGGLDALVRNMQMLELRENLIPVLLELRQMLQNRRSSLLGNLNKCLCALLQPHRQHLHQFILDTTIRSQIEHEINQLSNQSQ